MRAHTSFTVRNNLSEIGTVRQVITDFAERCQLPPDVLFAVNLALEEVLTNVISYGFSDDHDHAIDVRIDVGDGQLTAEVEDDGRPFNPLEYLAPDTTKPLVERPIGGLGIHLMRRFMDELEYRRHSGKNLLIMKKHWPPA